MKNTGRGSRLGSVGLWEDTATVPDLRQLTSCPQNWMLEPALGTGEELPELTLLTTLLEGPGDKMKV